MNPHLDMLADIRSAAPTQSIPGISELTEHLHQRMATVGEAAFQEFAYLQQVAAATWGPEQTSHFAIVLRKGRVAEKAPKVSRWKMARSAIDRLPLDWQSALREVTGRSEARAITRGLPILSADYLGAVTTALSRYIDYAASHNAATMPSGSDLHRYALWLSDPTNSEHGVSIRTAADYLSRIKAGLAIIAPSTVSSAREFVCRYWRDKSKAYGSPTKTGNQLVGAVAIYDLGFCLIEEARSKTIRGIGAATIFRNGLMLVLGTALPERARAISALEFGTTLRLEQPDRLRVLIPAQMLKRREDRKDGDPFDIFWHNERLVTLLEEYRLYYRPLFDQGTCLFPSVHAPGQSIGEKRIGQICAKITEEKLGVRIPIHRLRDNVGTDAAENLDGGRLATMVLLNHTDIGTGDHYDHSNNAKAAVEFGRFIDSCRSAPTALLL